MPLARGCFSGLATIGGSRISGASESSAALRRLPRRARTTTDAIGFTSSDQHRAFFFRPRTTNRSRTTLAPQILRGCRKFRERSVHPGDDLRAKTVGAHVARGLLEK